MFVLKNRYAHAELSEANFHAKLSHSKQLLKNIHPVILALFLFTDENIFTMATLKTYRMTDCRPTHIHVQAPFTYAPYSAQTGPAVFDRLCYPLSPQPVGLADIQTEVD